MGRPPPPIKMVTPLCHYIKLDEVTDRSPNFEKALHRWKLPLHGAGAVIVGPLLFSSCVHDFEGHLVIGEANSDVGSSRFWIGWVTRRGDKCARSTCRD
jgi:hypothetical protein